MASIKVETLLIILFCLLTTYLVGQSLDYAPNELLVKWKSSNIATQRTNLKTQFNLKERELFANGNMEIWKLADTADVLNLVKIYQKHPDIASVEPNYFYSTATLPPNDPMFDELWGINNTGQTEGTIGADINAIEGWAIQKESPSIQVAILDTGIDWGHPDLVDNIWQNLGEDADGDGHVLEWDGTKWIFDPEDENGIDDDGNGYIDDFIGWDFANNDNDPYDDHAHGTHVAGIIGARGDNGIGITGVTWKVQLVPLKFISKENRGLNSDAIKAINYATAMGIPISNNSWGGRGNSPFLKEAIQQAANQNHLFIAAAGNDSNNNDITPNYPSAYNLDNIISVAATTDKDSLLFISETKGSNYGATTIDLGAPGHRILSCLPNNNYGVADGTSMATPFVTGACALLLEQNNTQSYGDIKEQILNGVDVVPALQEKTVSGGRLNLYKVFGSCNLLADSLALVAFYYAADGPNWKNQWDFSHPFQTWDGVSVNDNGCVIGLSFTYNNLSKLPAEIGNLSNLEELSISGNTSGAIPTEIGKLDKLKSLILSINLSQSSIPAEIGNLFNLEVLTLANNQLIGKIPAEISNLQKLKVLNFSGNQLAGEIPAEISNLTNLQRLDFSKNNLTGRIPEGIEKLIRLEQIHLFNNQLEGNIPFGIGKLKGLKYLLLNDNNLTGNLPLGIAELTGLNFLNLSNNQLSSCFPTSFTIFCNWRPQQFDFSDNPQLPNNGNFIDFCDTGIGNCNQFSCRNIDSLVLVDLYLKTNGTNWNTAWDFNTPINTWNGVHVNSNGCLEVLNLSNNNLVGTIPNVLENLSVLKVLNLSNNQLSGSIPNTICQLSSLQELDLSNNQLSGKFPNTIGELISLQKLNLQVNNLTDSISWGISQLIQLEALNLSHNNLSNELPKNLSHLSNLKTLILNNNQLSGEIPVEISQLTNLEKIRLNDNVLSGCFPQNIDTLCGINFDFSNNQDLPGAGDFLSFCITDEGNCETICDRIADSTALIALYDATNGENWTIKWNLNEPIENWHGITTNQEGCVIGIKLNQNNLVGSIHSEIGDFPNLQKLILYNNQLTDTIPAAIGNLSNLRELCLTNNLLTGKIPPQLGNILTLEKLIINQNQLSGRLPKELGALIYLRNLSLKQNQLSDTLPKELGNLSNLSTLDFRINKLTGNIPKEIFEINTLKQLVLSDNELTGTIFTKLSNLPYLTTLALNNNNLTGSIPAELSKLTNLSYLSLNDNELEGIIPVDIGKLLRLQVIALHNNQLTGEIPQGLGEMSHLSRLYLNNNFLTGSIPADIGELRYLDFFYLNDNQLSGCFPESFQDLCNVVHKYDFSGNSKLNNNGDFDDFCDNGAANCQEPVWPGDFNNDGIVNNADALFWGLACENESGLARPDTSIEWYAHASPDWPNAVNSINNKHQDGDGNGKINLVDLAALHENYGKEYTAPISTSTTNGISYRLEPLSIEEAAENTILKYALHVELDDTPVALHGLACTINLGDLDIPSTPTLDLSSSSLVPDTSIVKFNAAENTLDIALTRTDKTNQLCDGAVGVLIVVIADHVAFGEPILLGIKNGHRISADGTFNAIAGTSLTSYTTTASSEAFISTSVVHEQCDRLGSAAVMVSGTDAYSIEWNTGANTSKITNLTAGDYSATVTYGHDMTDTINIEIEGQFLPIYDANGELQDCSIKTCPIAFTLANELTNNTYQAIKTISSSSQITAGNDVVFKAGESITLKSGFTAVAGSNFAAIIEDCTAPNIIDHINTTQTITKPKPITITTPTPPEQLAIDIFPNPVDYQTTIAYFLPSPEEIHLAIFDRYGRQMKTLLNGVFREAGRQQVEFFGNDLDSGVYFVVLQTKDKIETKKIIVLE